MLFRSLALLPLAVGSIAAEAVNFDGHQAFRIMTNGDPASVAKKLTEIEHNEWSHGTKDHMDISVSGDDVEKFKKMGFRFKQMHKDLGKDIREEKKWKPYHGKPGPRHSLPPDSWFDSYHPYEDHYKFWKDLQSVLPKNIEFISSGTSYEGRDLYGIKLSGNKKVKDKKAVVWHGNVHAREWSTSMTLEKIAYEMVSALKGGKGRRPDPEIRALVDAYDFYIIPFVNPDGFVYSQTDNRLWRKNRMPPPPDAANQTCYGVDVNRNWPYMWNAGEEGSWSPDPCSQVYHGESPGDTPENQGMRALINKIAEKQQIKLYSDWHSYGQYMLSPYGYACDLYPANSADQVDLAGEVSQVIESVHGTEFIYGPICQTLYSVGGGSTDYVYDVVGAEYSYAFELRDQGDYGFVLPPAQIRPTGEEMWAGVRYLLLNM